MTRSEFVRHKSSGLERAHVHNMLVAEVMAKTGVEQRNGLKRLKKLGLFKHIIDVLKKGHGELRVVIRLNKRHNARSYLPCSKCYGLFHKYEL